MPCNVIKFGKLTPNFLPQNSKIGQIGEIMANYPSLTSDNWTKAVKMPF